MLEDILQELAQRCVTNNKQIATAESCTGGLVAKLITDCAGSSQWFERGFITYSNLSKEQMLAVPHTLIERYGVVSEAVAEAMAKGVLEHSTAHYALAITGVAGPGGGSTEKPVGTVCFAWAYYESSAETLKILSDRQCFPGDREAVRTQSALFSLGVLNDILSKEYVAKERIAKE